MYETLQILKGSFLAYIFKSLCVVTYNIKLSRCGSFGVFTPSFCIRIFLFSKRIYSCCRFTFNLIHILVFRNAKRQSNRHSTHPPFHMSYLRLRSLFCRSFRKIINRMQLKEGKTGENAVLVGMWRTWLLLFGMNQCNR